jgi:hypothetical protein
MAISIKNDEADRLAREVSSITGESLTEAILVSFANGFRGRGRGDTL